MSGMELSRLLHQLGPNVAPVVGAKIAPGYSAARGAFDRDTALRRNWAKSIEPLTNSRRSNTNRASQRRRTADHFACFFHRALFHGSYDKALPNRLSIGIAC